MTSVVQQIAAQRVVPVIRSASVDDAVATARACARGGMRVVELTRSVPDVGRALEQLRDDGLTLGVGTITDADQVDESAAGGASFVVSFCHPPGFVDHAHAAGIVAVPGAFTPSEMARCAEAGARVVKLFPARLAVPAYLRDLRAVMPGLDVVVTGGISAAGDVEAWLAAGALAVGVGDSLGTVAALGAAEVEQRVRHILTHARGQKG